jgi:hypothetical protein
MRRSLMALTLVVGLLAACGQATTPPQSGGHASAAAGASTADPNAATAAHVAATVAHLNVLSKEAQGANDAGVLVDMLAMLNTLQQEQAWIESHADVSRPAIQVYQKDIRNAVIELQAALDTPTTTSVGAAASAVTGVLGAASLLTGQ